MKKIKKKIKALSAFTNIKEETIKFDKEFEVFICDEEDYEVFTKKEVKVLAKDYFYDLVYEMTQTAFQKGVLMMLQESQYFMNNTYIKRPMLDKASEAEKKDIEEAMEFLLPKKKAFKKTNFLNRYLEDRYNEVNGFYIEKV